MQELDTKRLHRMAKRLARKLLMHECPETMVQDLEQAAWVKYLTLSSSDHMWKDLYYAMLEEISRWLWSCKRGRGKDRYLHTKLALAELYSLGHHLTPEKYLMIKEATMQLKPNLGGRPKQPLCNRGHIVEIRNSSRQCPTCCADYQREYRLRQKALRASVPTVGQQGVFNRNPSLASAVLTQHVY